MANNTHDAKHFRFHSLGYCIFCLRKTKKKYAESKSAHTRDYSDSADSLRVVPRADISSLSSSRLLNTVNRMWPFFQTNIGNGNEDEEDLLAYLTASDSDSETGNHVLFTRLPRMCKFCASKLETVDMLMRELVREISSLRKIIRESKYRGKHSWRASKFEMALKNSCLERESIQAINLLLGEIGKTAVGTKCEEPFKSCNKTTAKTIKTNEFNHKNKKPLDDNEAESVDRDGTDKLMIQADGKSAMEVDYYYDDDHYDEWERKIPNAGSCPDTKAEEFYSTGKESVADKPISTSDVWFGKRESSPESQDFGDFEMLHSASGDKSRKSGVRKQTTVELRNQVVAAWKNRKYEPITYKELGKRFKIQTTTAFSIVQRYERTGSVSDKTRTGRKPKISPSGRMSRHMMKKLNIQPDVNWGRDYACDVCDKTYLSFKNLKAHKQSVHLRLRPCLCDTCGEKFVSDAVLANHRRIHTGERPFVCEVCGQGFRQREVLKRHVDGHAKKGSNFKPKGPMKKIRKRVFIKKLKPMIDENWNNSSS